MSRKLRDETLAVHAAPGRRVVARTVNPAIQRGSTVLPSSAAALYGTDETTYGRLGLEPQGALCEAMAALEGAAGARLFPSGLAAITGTLLALLKAGDEILVADCVYNPTRRFCNTLLKRFGVATRYFDPEAPAAEILAMASQATRLIFLESPGSLTFEISDTPALSAGARDRGLLTVIDNTWGAGLAHRPLALGADVSLQSLTKYVGGHADTFMGAAAARTPEILTMLDAGQLQVGWSTSPDDAYVMLRGVRTLPLRLEAHARNALAVAGWLSAQPEVQEVIHPPAPGSRGHDLWKRDFTGGNGLLSIVLRPAPEAAVLAMLDRLELFGLGFSWGGFESLAIHCNPQLKNRTIRKDYGGPVVRFHIGLEHPDDLTVDLRAALDAFAAHRA